jgi:hypothetical protein
MLVPAVVRAQSAELKTARAQLDPRPSTSRALQAETRWQKAVVQQTVHTSGQFCEKVRRLGKNEQVDAARIVATAVAALCRHPS